MPATTKEEVITHEAGNEEAWICLCDNTPSEDGFYPCDEKGDEVEPVAGWSGRYVCFRCGRIIDPESLRVVGRNSQPKLLV
ncbi:MAG TPA: hypothetical protein VN380_18185 [Thermoanaerobaculia bacterium]|jgi:hypothetical protein|nr:hypothetical protein [Thermoanaerobaculia bacterium]